MIFSLFLSLSAVSANDVNTTDDYILSATSNVDTVSANVNMENSNDTLSVYDEENILSVEQNSDNNNVLSTSSDLQQVIDSISAGTLTLNEDYELSSNITISSAITILGNGHHINGNNKYSFNVSGNGVSIQNLTISNLMGTHAIYWTGSSGSIVNCTFTDNTAHFGGAIYWHGANGTVSGCTFKDNTANMYGGAICWYGANGTVFGCNFTGNTANEYGGAIYWKGTDGSVVGCNFTGNTASGTSASGGGAISWTGSSGSVVNCTFTGNTANKYDCGGAIQWFGASGSVVGCNFTGNTVNEYGDGGAICWLGDGGSVVGCNFTGNTARYDGGAIRWTGDGGSVVGCNFTGNTATYSGGAIDWDGANGKVSGCIFTGNTATSRAGAIYWFGASGKVSGCIFTGNTATSRAGAIYWYGANGRVVSCNFTGNNATTSGGAIYWSGFVYDELGSPIIISGGGPISGSGGSGNVSGCIFTGNTANRYGGALFIENTNVRMYNNTFTNFTMYTAGAIYFNSGNSILSNSSFFGVDAIWINKTATVNMTKNNITSPIKNKNMTYLTTSYNINPVPYSVWNEGNLTLDKNNFDCLIFNDGIIDSHTIIKILDNTTVNATLNSTFTFWASIFDDNNNTIISVRSLNSTNDVVGNYSMPYNAYATQVDHNGTFHISGNDLRLTNSVKYNGTLNVLLNTAKSNVPINVSDVVINVDDDAVVVVSVPTSLAGQNITIRVNGESRIVTVNASGRANATFIGLVNATYEVIVDYEGDANNYANVTNASIRVNKLSPVVVLNITDIFVGADAVINITGPADRTGHVSVLVDGVNYYARMIDGNAILTVRGLSVGNYTVVVTYLENDKYVSKNASASLIVSDVASPIIKVDTNGTLNVTVPGGNGTVYIYVDGNRTGPYNVTNGTVNGTLPTLTPGNHNVIVLYNGTDNSTSTNSTVINIPKVSDFLFNITAENIKVGQDAVIVANLPSDAKGYIIVTVGGKTEVIDLTAGNSTSVSGLSNGTYTVSARYLGSDIYTEKVNTTGLTVLSVASPIINVTGNGTLNVTVPGGNGTVIIYINGTPYGPFNVTNGTVNSTIGSLGPGNHTIIVIFNGTDNSTSTNSTIINIPKVFDFLFNITSSDIYVGSDAVIRVNAPCNATGIVLITIGNRTAYVVLGGDNTTRIAGLTVGEYSVDAIYLGDNYYASRLNSTSIVVKAVPVVNIAVSSNGTLNGTVSGTDGTIIIYVNGTSYGPYNVTNGTVNGTLPGNFTPGNYTVIVVYNGTDNSTFNRTVEIVIPKVSDFLFNITASDIYVGSDAVIRINLPANATGKVLVRIGNRTAYVDLSEDRTVVIGGLEAGTYSVDANYLGDDYYVSKVNSTGITVKAVPVVNITVSPNGTINGTVPGTDGTIIIYVNGTSYGPYNVTNGTVNGTLPGNFTPGNYTVIVVYNGTDNSTFNRTVEIVIPKVSDFLFNITASDIYVGSDAVINITGPSDRTGSLIVLVDGVMYYANMTDGNATLTVRGLSVGNYTVVVTYLENDKYVESVAVGYVNVTAKITTLMVVNVTVPGNSTSGVVNVTLPVDATGNVSVVVDGIVYNATDLVNGSALINISDILPGNHTVEVVYSGDGNYDSVSYSSTVNVPKVDNYSVNVSSVVDGSDVSISVELPVDASGVVLIDVGGKSYYANIADGKATLTLTDLDNGDYDVVVRFMGDDYYAAKMNSTSFVVEDKVTPIVDVSVDIPENSTSVTVVVDLPDDAIGDVVVTVGDKNYTVPVEEGKVVLDISDLELGDYDIVVTYFGDDKYESKTVETNVTVGRKLVITVSDVIKYYSGPERLFIYTTDNEGNKLSNIAVAITINGVTYSRTSVDGRASIALNIPSGNYTINVKFAGDDNFGSQSVDAYVEILPTIYANDVFKVFRNGTQYYALFLDGEGNPLVNTSVSFNIHGVSYTRTTNASGWARLNINIEAGKYIITAVNLVTGEMKSNNITVFTLIESGDLVKYYRNGSQFVIRVRGADGNWAKAGEEVTFNINGVFYTRYTNETGHVKLNINLGSGEYIITSYYKDCRESNKVSVLPRLITSDLVMVSGGGSVFTAKTLDEQGNIASHQKVSFNIEGMLYDGISDDNGEVRIVINLPAGEYLITSYYLFERNGNKIIIRDS